MPPCAFRPLPGVVHQWTTVQCAHFHKIKLTERHENEEKQMGLSVVVICNEQYDNQWFVVSIGWIPSDKEQREKTCFLCFCQVAVGSWQRVENVKIVVKVKLFHFCFSCCAGQQRATIFVFGKTRTISWPMGANRSSQWTCSSSQRPYAARAANCWFKWAPSSNFYWMVSVEWVCQCSSVGTSTVPLFVSSLKQQSPIAVLLLFHYQIHQSSPIEESWTTIVEQRRPFNWLREWARHQHQRRRTLLAGQPPNSSSDAQLTQSANHLRAISFLWRWVEEESRVTSIKDKSLFTRGKVVWLSWAKELILRAQSLCKRWIVFVEKLHQQTFDNQPAIVKYTGALQGPVLVYDMDKSAREQPIKPEQSEDVPPQLIFESRFEGANLRQVTRL